MIHKPVMVDEITSVFAEVPGGVIIDATYGLGGHTRALIEKFGNKFRYLGIDRDGETLKAARKDRPESVEIRQMNFAEISSILNAGNISPVTGLLFDLGLSSLHIDDPSRGFSYQANAPLDLRFDRSSGRTAAEIIAEINEAELTHLIKEYGQEKKARAISKNVIKLRPRTTGSLSEIIKSVVGPRGFNKAAARVFQALRIYVNDELATVREGISGMIPALAVGGRIAVISYHSIEDRIVKRLFALNAGKCFCGPQIAVCECGARKILKILTPKPMRPSPREVEVNPRARSARLRYAERI